MELVDRPTLRFFSEAREYIHDEGVLESLQRNPWQICMPSEDNIYWSVAMSYLMSVINHDSTEINERVVRLAKCESTDVEKIVACVKNYNPFLNRNACFINSDMINFVATFKNALSTFIVDQGNSKYFSHVEHSKKNQNISTGLTQSSLLQASALLLKRKITLVVPESSGHREKQLKFSLYLAGQTEIEMREGIVLYGVNKLECENPQLHVGLDRNIAFSLQNEAFRNILRNSEFKDCDALERIFSQPALKVNLFTALLKEGHVDLTKDLLRAPLQFPFRLQEAGLGTDPTVPEAGSSKTAFFYVLCTGDQELAFLMYTYFINTALWSINSSRQPDVNVVEHLITLTKILDDTLEQYKISPVMSEEGIVLIQQLIAFHHYQVQVCKKIVELRQKDAKDEEGKIIEANRRKNIILAILEAHSDHFYMNKEFEESDELKTIKLYEMSTKFQGYFDSLDFQSALFYFDNIFSLKQKLKLDPKTYESLETPFARFMYFCKSFVSEEPLSNSAMPQHKEVFSQLKEDVFMRLVVLERINLKGSIDSFRRLLARTEVDDGNAISQISSKDVHTLETEPILKDEYVLLRLKHYIKLALETDLDDDEDFEVGALVIERCLQVIGEAVSFEESETPTLIKTLLISSLQAATKADLRRIRHRLSHSDCNAIAARLEIQNDKKFFQNIKEEIRAINESFDHIYEFQSSRIKAYMFKYFFGSIQKWKTSLEKCERMVSESTSAGRSEMSTNFDSNQSKSFDKALSDSKKCLDIFSRRVEEQKEDLIEKTNIFKQHIEMHLSYLEKKCGGLQQNKNFDNNARMVEQTFLSVKLLLRFALTEGSPDENSYSMLRDEIGAFSTKINCRNIDQMFEKFKELCSRVIKIIEASPSFGADSSKGIPKVDCGKVIQKVKKVLTGFCYVSEQGKQSMLAAVPQKYVKHHEAKLKLEESFQTGEFLSENDLDHITGDLVLKSRKIKTYKAKYNEHKLDDMPEMKDYYQILQDALNEDKMTATDYDIICRNFNFTQEQKEELKRIVQGNPKRVKDKTFEFFYTSVKKLKTLLTKRFPEIFIMFSNTMCENSIFKKYPQDKLVFCYLQDPVLQAAIEQLLFDCMIVLKERKTDLEHLWLKANSLFSGICLRNVFAHGNPLFECIGNIVDPSDLPNEIIAKVLELVFDFDAIEAMYTLLEENTYFEDYVSNVHATTHHEHHHVWVKIGACRNWEGYARILPQKPTSKNSVSQKST